MRRGRWLVLLGVGSLAACGPTVVTLGDDPPTDAAGMVPSMDAAVPDTQATPPPPDVRDAARPDVVVAPTPDTGSHDADAGGPTGCPTNPPTSNTPCTPVGEQCEYGTNPAAVCNQVAACAASGWVYLAASSPCSTGTCPTTYPTTGSPDGGVDCDPKGLVCSYPEGTCGCEPPGSATTGDAGLRWTCQPSQVGCPQPRPNIGTACGAASVTCNYGACAGGLELTCKSGTWQPITTPCPP